MTTIMPCWVWRLKEARVFTVKVVQFRPIYLLQRLKDHAAIHEALRLANGPAAAYPIVCEVQMLLNSVSVRE